MFYFSQRYHLSLNLFFQELCQDWYYFAEDQGRYIIEINQNDLKNVVEVLETSSVHYDELGVVIEKELVIDDRTKLTIDELLLSNNNWLTNYMNK